MHISISLLVSLLLVLGCTAQKQPPSPISVTTSSTTSSSATTPQIISTNIPTPLHIEGVYLPFENGFMVYIEGQDCLYAYAYSAGIILPRETATGEFSNYRYCLPFTDLPEAPDSAPENPFGRVWLRYADVAETLGAANGRLIRYMASTPLAEPVAMGGVFYGGIITLPDSMMLYCGMRSATAGTCELRAP